MVGFLQYYITMVFAFCVNLIAQCSGNDVLYSQNNYNNIKGVKEIKRTDYNKSVLNSLPISKLNIYFDRDGFITEVAGDEIPIGNTSVRYTYNWLHKATSHQSKSHACISDIYTREISMVKTSYSYYVFSFDNLYTYKGYRIKTLDSIKRQKEDISFNAIGDTTFWTSHFHEGDTEIVVIKDFTQTDICIDTGRVTTLSKNKYGYPLKTYTVESFSFPNSFYSNYSYTYY